MGYYINPKNEETKEEWLEDYGTEVPREVFVSFNFDNDELPVCLVDNGGFTAAGIAYCREERDVMASPDSGTQRPRRYYLVPKADLVPWYSENG